MAYSFDLLKEFDDNRGEIKKFIEDTDKIIISEQISSYKTLINQLLGHYNQLLIRVQDLISKEEFSKNINFQKDVSSKLESLKEENDLDLLNSLEKLYKDTEKSYHDINKIVLSTIKNDNSILEYNNLTRRINENIVRVNNFDLPKSIIDELLPIYNEAKEIKDISKLNQLQNKLQNIITTNTNTTINDKQGNKDERIFSLFAKINDQIIDSSFLTKNNLIYACYTLEDNSKYYAIVKDEKEIKIIDQNFSNLPNLVLTKDKIIETCKIIIKNAGIYYNLNEYMRYIEKSYKTKVTKEIDDLIAKYKTRLTSLEENINLQLSFIDDIALLVNHKPCPKYPNIIYNDIKLEAYFKKGSKDSKLREIERLIVEVLLNPNVKSEFDTKSILKTLYDNDVIDSLLTSIYSSIKQTPQVNTADNINSDLTVPNNNIKTNNEKIESYLKSRVQELELLSSSPKINVTITKDDNTLFKDINTVLDLNTAIVICDKVYKKGQGNYAVTDYLKTGNTLKFTSKYKARDLASTVNRDNYLKLLLENILKRYIYLKTKNIPNDIQNFIESFLSKDNVDLKTLVQALLNDENIINNSINNFDYELLNVLSNKNKIVEEELKSSNDLIISKINKILEDIKKTNNLID